MAEHHHAVIIGAGAAGLYCARFAAARGGSVLLVDHSDEPGEKIRISGGGRCNFTNTDCGPHAFLSQNPHFCKSALKRHTQWDFIDRVQEARIDFHEKTLGQLFCDGSSRQIVDMLCDDAARAGVELELETEVHDVERTESGFLMTIAGPTGSRPVTADTLVIATGGKSIPKMGATGYAFQAAEHFGLGVTEIRPALVPLTFGDETLERLAALSGVSVFGAAMAGGARFEEALLFTHRGLSGPAILQISSYWREGEEIGISLMPGGCFEALKAMRSERGGRFVSTALSELIPRRLALQICAVAGVDGNLADMSDAALRDFAGVVENWRLKPTGSEGWRTAEVTLGGVDTAGLSSKTMEARDVPGLFFIGEAVDVTGWLGGYNFQWAWSSGWAAGTEIASRVGG
ncbi:NAD(P)/FAD-dependent oxidoreductase [Rhodovulum sp. DZ06]|uniref:NAD(P)/FAD-dependent oxidoreductase n=1 Tax=Rhodovulum sp. DZ06 TaxID=3425126 RepID=UPI003D32C014